MTTNYFQEENNMSSRMIKESLLDQILDLQLFHDIEVVRGEDYQYQCVINGDGYGSALTTVGALLVGCKTFIEYNDSLVQNGDKVELNSTGKQYYTHNNMEEHVLEYHSQKGTVIDQYQMINGRNMFRVKWEDGRIFPYFSDFLFVIK